MVISVRITIWNIYSVKSGGKAFKKYCHIVEFKQQKPFALIWAPVFSLQRSRSRLFLSLVFTNRSLCGGKRSPAKFQKDKTSGFSISNNNLQQAKSSQENKMLVFVIIIGQLCISWTDYAADYSLRNNNFLDMFIFFPLLHRP